MAGLRLTYVQGNPVNATDPNGLQACPAAIGQGVRVGLYLAKSANIINLADDPRYQKMIERTACAAYQVGETVVEHADEIAVGATVTSYIAATAGLSVATIVAGGALFAVLVCFFM